MKFGASVFVAQLGVFLSNEMSANSADFDVEHPIVVIGSGGKTGKVIVRSMLEKGLPVKPTYRGVIPDFDESLSLNLKPSFIDVTKIDTIDKAIKDASVVIFAASASNKGGNAEKVDYLGVKNVAQSCVNNKVKKLIVISSGAITKPNSIGFKITNLFGRIMDFKLLGEKSLIDIFSNQNYSSYIIVRPGGLTDGEKLGPGGIELNQGDTILGEVSRKDVADCVVAAATSATLPKNVIFEIYAENTRSPLQGEFPNTSGFEQSGSKLGDYESLFRGLKSGVNGF